MGADRIVTFVLSGGIGSRLWPLSREDRPKQFHALRGGDSMLAQTLRRAAAGDPQAPVVVIASSLHAAAVRQELAAIGGGRFGAIFEPVGRNTAAAVAVAAQHALAAFGDELVLVVPSDHDISTDHAFWTSVRQGAEAAAAGRLVVFGIPPLRAETGYGYIEGAAGNGPLVDVLAFKEKPDHDTARAYVERGDYYWNAGIFLFRASAMKAAFLQHRPDIWEAVQAAYDAAGASGNEVRLPSALYGKVPSTSVDYAIMEASDNIAMVPGAFRWNDLGSWESIHQASERDGQGNALVGDAIAIDSAECYLRGENILVAAVGVKGMTVIATQDAVFISPMAQSQEVKKAFECLQSLKRPEIKRSFSALPSVEPAAARRWLFEQALPRWAAEGVDRRFGGFHEALDFSGRALPRLKRTRTMARQIYSFAAAAALGWEGPAREIADHGLTFLAERARSAGGGWVRALNGDGSVADPVEDSYDTACVLLALAAAARAGNGRAAPLARETVAFLDAHLADPAHGGVHEDMRRSLPRRSNPHMHLLEAYLALHDALGDEAYLGRAAAIVDLFRTRLFDEATWTLGEYFGPDWRAAGGGAGDITEPGHQYEWAALLLDFARRSQDTTLTAYARRLYATAAGLGSNPATGLAYATVTRHGNPIDPVSRTWPQTEALNAAVALAQAGEAGFAAHVERRAATLFARHIWPAPEGLWIDRIDAAGRPVAEEVPASILYHLVMALERYLAFARD